jgi:TPP-dependent indolepyruvate ferredoxin oxidoreductase alpha subunit
MPRPSSAPAHHLLPEHEARRVISVIGDSTFVHSGLTGLAEMFCNPPPAVHVVLILDNGTTAMTGQQEHPGIGRLLEFNQGLRSSGVVQLLGGDERVQVVYQRELSLRPSRPDPAALPKLAIAP